MMVRGDGSVMTGDGQGNLFRALERGDELEGIVQRGTARKYYRFRPARFYGGIVTGDVVGCNLLCRFCWASDRVRDHPESTGKFYTPEEAFSKLAAIGERTGYRQVRLSGQEPTVGFEHLLALLALFEGTGYTFILETNGIVLGARAERAEQLAAFEQLQLHVRVSLKGTNGKEFAFLTGADPEGFELQLRALSNLVDAGVSCHPAVMVSFSEPGALFKLQQRLAAIHPPLARNIEREELILYAHAKRRLEGLSYSDGHDPSCIPPELI
jgi:uncharacterized Fe-S cluster-containing radical SAM superfamily protein